MNSNNLLIQPKTQPARRVGLSRNDYRSAPLLSTINGRSKDSLAPDNMPTKAARTAKAPKASNPTKTAKTRFLVSRRTGVKEKGKESDSEEDDLLASPERVVKQKKVMDEVAELDVYAAPKGSSDEASSSEDERGKSLAIKGTVFGPARGASKSQTSIGKGKNAAKSGLEIASPSNPRTTKLAETSSSGNSKRKGKEDLFGSYKIKKAKTTYSQNTKSTSSQATRLKSTQDDEDSPSFILPDDVLPTPKKNKRPGVQLNMPTDDLDSPDSTPASTKQTKAAAQKLMDLKDSKGTIADSDDDDDDVEKVDFSYLHGLDSPALTKQSPLEDDLALAKFHVPATQAPEFINYSLDDSGIISQAKDIVRQGDDLASGLVNDHKPYDYTQTQHPSTCPMCQAPVDPEELKARGKMNTRAQEQFCQSHQRKTAREDWKERGYPEINWEALPLRLSKFRRTIDNWINGEDSYFRKQYGIRVAAGKDKTLRKQTSNLIPGYYGSRGLQAISEHVMQNHTKLLKKVAPKDSLMSRNGVAAYVQAVLVFEIATLLVMDDMNVEEEKAREILDDSVVIGELLHEEIKDVHVSRVEDSEDEDSDMDELA